jgi:hypothetical protein
MNRDRVIDCLILIALIAVALTGCSGGDDDVVVPKKPPLSAEAARENLRRQQQDRIKTLQDQAKRSGKK